MILLQEMAQIYCNRNMSAQYKADGTKILPVMPIRICKADARQMPAMDGRPIRDAGASLVGFQGRIL